MRTVTLIRGARQLLTLRGPTGPRRGADLRNLGIIQDGAVLIADGLILEVGHSRRLENLALARGATEVDASGCVVMPGFVDGNLQLLGGTDLSPRALKTPALRKLDDAVRYGTTAVEAKSGAGFTEAAELKILRLYAELKELPLTFVPTFLAGYVADGFGERFLATLRRRKLAEFAEIRCEDGAFTPAQACQFLARARELRFGVKMSAGHRSRPDSITMAIERAAVAVDDVTNASEREASILAQSQTMVTMSPAVAFHLQAECYPPARMLIDSGAAVALASGWHPECAPPPNMQMTIGLACRSMNMTVAEAITASTINGAHAIGRAEIVGSIEAGKRADLTILAVPDYRELPYHFGVNLVNSVMISGTILVERSKVKWPLR